MVDQQGGWVKTPYENLMEWEGVPVFQSLVGVEDIAELPFGPWDRIGGEACFVQLRGMIEEGSGVFVARIPPGQALEPERHLYLKAIFIIEGRGSTEVWYDEGARASFEWSQGSVFAIPLNAWHRMYNGSSSPVLYVGVTTAPSAMNAIRDHDLLFNCDAPVHTDFHKDPGTYYVAGSEYNEVNRRWITNFIPDIFNGALRPGMEHKVAAGIGTGYRMAGGFPTGHLSEWPVGVYHKAHHHGPGALLTGLKGEGYVLLWPHEYGMHPYQDGHTGEVVEMRWQARSIYSPPAGWYHMHFNTSSETARHIAIYGALTPRITVFDAFIGEELSIMTDSKQGGALIEYEDEDPAIRERFEAILAEKGIESRMPSIASDVAPAPSPAQGKAG